MKKPWKTNGTLDLFPRRFHLQYQYLLFERFLQAFSQDYKKEVIMIRSNQIWKYRTLSGEWEEARIELAPVERNGTESRESEVKMNPGIPSTIGAVIAALALLTLLGLGACLKYRQNNLRI